MSKPASLMGIIGCRMFEDEIVHLIDRDKDIRRVVLIENDDSGEVEEKLLSLRPDIDIHMIKEREVSTLVPPRDFSVLLWIKPMALHSNPDKLNDDVAGSIVKIEGKCGAVLLLYGLCGNAFKRIDDMAKTSAVPIVILKDARGEIVDDCIGAVLGGTEEYYNALKKASGTFFLTPMWAENWRELFHKVQILPDPSDIEGARYIFECVGYKAVVKLNTGLGDKDRFDQNIEEFANIFSFEKREHVCTLDVVDASYDAVKDML